jgi:hypothetical protein
MSRDIGTRWSVIFLKTLVAVVLIWFMIHWEVLKYGSK